MQKWIAAARLRTLPLSFSSIIIGNALAYKQGIFSWSIAVLALLTTFFLQILSNYANDYGDFKNGADLSGRIGPQRAVQSGEISVSAMKNAIILFIFLCLVSGTMLLYFTFDGQFQARFWLFLGLGLTSIVAAYTYTAGKNPYGYAGLGDISVFLFFGLVGVIGSYYLQVKSVSVLVVTFATACGLLATGVLNINNIRDIESDSRAGKMTIPVRLGKSNAIKYHWFLLVSASILIFIGCYLLKQNITLYLIIIPIMSFYENGINVSKLENPDTMLKQLALSTFVFSIILAFFINS